MIKRVGHFNAILRTIHTERIDLQLNIVFYLSKNQHFNCTNLTSQIDFELHILHMITPKKPFNNVIGGVSNHLSSLRQLRLRDSHIGLFGYLPRALTTNGSRRFGD